MNDKDFKKTFIISMFLVYVVWGSTYLAIKFVNYTMPPMLAAGVRFLTAGLVLYFWKRTQGHKAEKRHWKPCLIAGALFFLVANGSVVLGIQYVDSGITALIIALSPVFIVIYDQILERRITVGILTITGLFVGLVGQIILINPMNVLAGSNLHLGGVLLILLSPISWSAGAVYTQRTDMPASRGLAAAMQMISGGVLLILGGILRGELSLLDIGNISALSISCLLYLIIFGSIITFSAYNWLIKNTTVAMLGTIGFVNPVVALGLGVLFGGELLDFRSVLAALIILSGVLLITWDKNKKSRVAQTVAKSEFTP